MDKELTISKFYAHGLSFYLSDGTIWDVQPGDNTISGCWSPGQRVAVTWLSDGAAIIENLDTAAPNKIKARIRP